MNAKEKGKTTLVRDSLQSSSLAALAIPSEPVLKIPPPAVRTPKHENYEFAKSSQTTAVPSTSKAVKSSANYSTMPWGHRLNKKKSSSKQSVASTSSSSSSSTRTLCYPPSEKEIYLVDEGSTRLRKAVVTESGVVKDPPIPDENRNYVKVKPMSKSSSLSRVEKQPTASSSTSYLTRSKTLKKRNNDVAAYGTLRNSNVTYGTLPSSRSRVEQNGEYVLLFPVSRPDTKRTLRKSHLYQEIPDDSLLQMTKSASYRTTYNSGSR